MRVFLGIVALSLAVTGRVDAELIFQTVNVPGATSTVVTGVSAAGNEITGSFTLTQNGPGQGFVATSVPGPATLLLIVSGVLGMAAYAKRGPWRDKANRVDGRLRRHSAR